MLELFFSPTITSQAAGKAWLSRIAARQADREPEASPQVAAAQLAALKEWGARRHQERKMTQPSTIRIERLRALLLQMAT
jgi:hypothetical protein